MDFDTEKLYNTLKAVRDTHIGFSRTTAFANRDYLKELFDEGLLREEKGAQVEAYGKTHSFDKLYLSWAGEWTLSLIEEERQRVADERSHQREQEAKQDKEKRVDRLLDLLYFVLGLVGGYVIGWVHPLSDVSPASVWQTVADFVGSLFK